MRTDAVLEKMMSGKIKMTRANYLELLFFGEVPGEIDPEVEVELPRRFQLDPPEEFD